MNKFEAVLIFSPELATAKLKDEINNFKSNEGHAANN